MNSKTAEPAPAARRGRGRPPLWKDEAISSVESSMYYRIQDYFNGGKTTHRTRVDHMHCRYAQIALSKDDDRKKAYGWLLGDFYTGNQADGKPKKVILTELGRVANQEDIRELASVICEHRLRTAEAVRYIRQCRGVTRSPSREQLQADLARVIDDYRARCTRPTP